MIHVTCFHSGANPVRNSSGGLNPAGIILKSNPAAEQRGMISNGANRNPRVFLCEVLFSTSSVIVSRTALV